MAALLSGGLLASVSAAPIFQYPPAPTVEETLVEGHTVFAVLDEEYCYAESDPVNETVCPGDISTGDHSESLDVRANVTVQRLGTAVAVLVRDRAKAYVAPPPSGCARNGDVVSTLLYENPGVLWFNDRFLVGDDLDVVEARVDANLDVCERRTSIVFEPDAIPWRYPCGGWVLGTRAGGPDPRSILPFLGYRESYLITDPNDYVWIVDRFDVVNVAAVPNEVDVMQDLQMDDDDGPGTAPDYDDHEDGDLRVRYGPAPGTTSSVTTYLAVEPVWSVPVLGVDAADTRASCPPYVDLASHDDDSATAAYEDGGDGSPARLYNAVLFFYFDELLPTGAKVHGANALDDTDATGCEAGTEWECDAAGAEDDGREGNSHPFNPSDATSGPVHVHPTAEVDLYWSNVAPPSPASQERRYAVRDTVGGTSPYHAHGPEPFDDRLASEGACYDRDVDEEHWTYSWDGQTTTQTGHTASHYETDRYGDGEAPTDGSDTSDCA